MTRTYIVNLRISIEGKKRCVYINDGDYKIITGRVRKFQINNINRKKRMSYIKEKVVKRN